MSLDMTPRPGLEREPEALGRRRSTAKHKKILESAQKLVGKDGYQAVTMEAIAEAAGAGKQTLYRWWPSKANLMLELYVRQLPADAVSPDAEALEDGDTAAALEALLAKTFRSLKQNSGGDILLGLATDPQQDSKVRQRLLDSLVYERPGMLLEALKAAEKAGRFAKGFDAAWTAEAVCALVWHRLLAGRPLTPTVARDAVAHLIKPFVVAPKKRAAKKSTAKAAPAPKAATTTVAAKKAPAKKAAAKKAPAKKPAGRGKGKKA